MKVSEIASRLTGISTPLGGLSWEASEAAVSAARRTTGLSATLTLITLIVARIVAVFR